MCRLVKFGILTALSMFGCEINGGPVREPPLSCMWYMELPRIVAAPDSPHYEIHVIRGTDMTLDRCFHFGSQPGWVLFLKGHVEETLIGFDRAGQEITLYDHVDFECGDSLEECEESLANTHGELVENWHKRGVVVFRPQAGWDVYHTQCRKITPEVNFFVYASWLDDGGPGYFRAEDVRRLIDYIKEKGIPERDSCSLLETWMKATGNDVRKECEAIWSRCE